VIIITSFYHSIFVPEQYGMRNSCPAVLCCIERVILRAEYSLQAGLFEKYGERNISKKDAVGNL
jgi:hypothetical protein